MSNSKAFDLVRGLSMGSHFLKSLMDEIEKQGGDPEMIQFLTRPRFEENLSKLAETIIGLDFRIPANEMRERSERWYRAEFDVEEGQVEIFRNLYWYATLGKLGIPYLDFDAENDRPVPVFYKNKLQGRTMEYPLFLEEYVVVDIGFHNHEVTKVGEVMPIDDINILCLAERRYFDFDK